MLAASRGKRILCNDLASVRLSVCLSAQSFF